MSTTTNAGFNYEVRNITLNANTDTQIDFNQQVNSVLIKARTAVDIYLRRSSGGSNYLTIPSGTALTLDVAMTDTSQGGYIVGWLRASSGNPIAEVIGSF